MIEIKKDEQGRWLMLATPTELRTAATELEELASTAWICSDGDNGGDLTVLIIRETGTT